MSLLRRLKRRHRSSRSKSYATVGLDKLAAGSNEHASKRDRLTTQRAAAEYTDRFVPSSGESDRIPVLSSRAEKATNKGRRTSTGSVSQAEAADPVYASTLDRTDDQLAALREFPKSERNRVLQGIEKLNIKLWKQGRSDWLNKARTASFLVVKAAVEFTLIFALISNMLMRKWHGRHPETLPAARLDEDGSLSSACFKFTKMSHQNLSSDKSVSSKACQNLTALPGISAMHFKRPVGNAALKKVRNLYGPKEAGRSSAVAIDSPPSATASPRNFPAEECTGIPGDPSSAKHRTRFKSKNLLKHLRKKQPFSAPSSPMGSNQDKLSFCDASMHDESALQRPVVLGKLDCSSGRPPPSFSALDLLSDQEVSHTSDKTKGKRFFRPVSSLRQEKVPKNPVRVGSTWTAVGLLITVAGLFGGRTVAIVGLVFWWMLLSKVHRRPAIGEPFIGNNSAAQITRRSLKENSNSTIASGRVSVLCSSEAQEQLEPGRFSSQGSAF